MEGSGAQFDWVYATSVLSSVFARVVQKVERMIADAPIVLSTIFVLATLSVLLYYDYNLARKKGFRYPGAICLVAAFWMAALALASAVYSLLPESLQEKDYLFFSFLILIALVITPAFKLLLQALPTRSVRVYGQRRVRVPFIFLGTVVILVSSVALLNGIAGAIFGIPTGLYMILLGRRLRSPQAPALLPGHNEPIGALYLRPFQQEPRYFVYGDRKKYSAYYKQLHGGHRLTFFWRNVQHRRDVRTILSFRRGRVRWSIRCVGQSGGLHSARRCVSAVC